MNRFVTRVLRIVLAVVHSNPPREGPVLDVNANERSVTLL
jgi:hypothetical protein